MYLFRYLLFISAGEDAYLQPDQSRPSLPLIHELLAAGSGAPTTLPSPCKITLSDGTRLDLSYIDNMCHFSRVRRVEARKTNPRFPLGSFHKFIGSLKWMLFSLTRTVSDVNGHDLKCLVSSQCLQR